MIDIDSTTEFANPIDEMMAGSPESQEILTNQPIVPISIGENPDKTLRATDVRRETEEDTAKSQTDVNFIYPVHLVGLNLEFVKGNNIKVLPGRWGIEGTIYNSTAAMGLSVPIAVSTTFFVFIAASDDDPNKFKVFLARSADGGNAPKGFSRFRRIGVVFTDTTSRLHEFVQCGEFWQKTYTLLEPLAVQSGITAAFTLISGAGLPSGLCSFRFHTVYDTAATSDVTIYCVPEIPSTGTPGIFNSHAVFATRGSTIIIEFDIDRSRTDGIWVAYAPTPTVTGVLQLRGFTDDLS